MKGCSPSAGQEHAADVSANDTVKPSSHPISPEIDVLEQMGDLPKRAEPRWLPPPPLAEVPTRRMDRRERAWNDRQITLDGRQPLLA